MRRPCTLLLIWLGCLAAGAPLKANARTARDVIVECAQRAKADVVGMNALRATCPNLATAIGALGLTPHLPQGWKDHVTAAALVDWTALADRYDGSAAPSSLPDSSRLQTIAALLRPPPEPLNWWQRLKSWLESGFDPNRGQWPDWLHWPSQWRPGKAFLYSVMGLVLIGAAVVIAMELHAGGVFGGASRRHRTRLQRAAAAALKHPWQESEETHEPTEQLPPQRLLRVLVAALNKSHRLERDRDLTCRELITAACFDTPAQREIFAGVAILAERALYGDPRGTPPSPDEKLHQSARALCAQLLAASAGQRSK